MIFGFPRSSPEFYDGDEDVVEFEEELADSLGGSSVIRGVKANMYPSEGNVRDNRDLYSCLSQKMDRNQHHNDPDWEAEDIEIIENDNQTIVEILERIQDECRINMSKKNNEKPLPENYHEAVKVIIQKLEEMETDESVNCDINKEIEHLRAVKPRVIIEEVEDVKHFEKEIPTKMPATVKIIKDYDGEEITNRLLELGSHLLPVRMKIGTPRNKFPEETVILETNEETFEESMDGVKSPLMHEDSKYAACKIQTESKSKSLAAETKKGGKNRNRTGRLITDEEVVQRSINELQATPLEGEEKGNNPMLSGEGIIEDSQNSGILLGNNKGGSERKSAQSLRDMVEDLIAASLIAVFVILALIAMFYTVSFVRAKEKEKCPRITIIESGTSDGAQRFSGGSRRRRKSCRNHGKKLTPMKRHCMRHRPGRISPRETTSPCNSSGSSNITYSLPPPNIVSRCPPPDVPLCSRSSSRRETPNLSPYRQLTPKRPDSSEAKEEMLTDSPLTSRLSASPLNAVPLDQATSETLPTRISTITGPGRSLKSFQDLNVIRVQKPDGFPRPLTSQLSVTSPQPAYLSPILSSHIQSPHLISKERTFHDGSQTSHPSILRELSKSAIAIPPADTHSRSYSSFPTNIPIERSQSRNVDILSKSNISVQPPTSSMQFSPTITSSALPLASSSHSVSPGYKRRVPISLSFTQPPSKSPSHLLSSQRAKSKSFSIPFEGDGRSIHRFTPLAPGQFARSHPDIAGSHSAVWGERLASTLDEGKHVMIASDVPQSSSTDLSPTILQPAVSSPTFSSPSRSLSSHQPSSSIPSQSRQQSPVFSFEHLPSQSVHSHSRQKTPRLSFEPRSMHSMPLMPPLYQPLSQSIHSHDMPPMPLSHHSLLPSIHSMHKHELPPQSIHSQSMSSSTHQARLPSVHSTSRHQKPSFLSHPLSSSIHSTSRHEPRSASIHSTSRHQTPSFTSQPPHLLSKHQMSSFSPQLQRSASIHSPSRHQMPPFSSKHQLSSASFHSELPKGIKEATLQDDYPSQSKQRRRSRSVSVSQDELFPRPADSFQISSPLPVVPPPAFSPSSHSLSQSLIQTSIPSFYEYQPLSPLTLPFLSETHGVSYAQEQSHPTDASSSLPMTVPLSVNVCPRANVSPQSQSGLRGNISTAGDALTDSLLYNSNFIDQSPISQSFIYREPHEKQLVPLSPISTSSLKLRKMHFDDEREVKFQESPSILYPASTPRTRPLPVNITSDEFEATDSANGSSGSSEESESTRETNEGSYPTSSESVRPEESADRSRYYSALSSDYSVNELSSDMAPDYMFMSANNVFANSSGDSDSFNSRK
eukprot:gi/632936207/ref/XP_007892920.1/ PREDICTED: putative GPI-anchored protein PB15E9.01c [Callorhinchus milii]